MVQSMKARSRRAVVDAYWLGRAHGQCGVPEDDRYTPITDLVAREATEPAEDAT